MIRQMRLAKVSKSADGYRWLGTASDDEVDLKHTRLALSIFSDFIERAQVHGQPSLNVAHYPNGVIGQADQMFVDGNRFKIGGVFDSSPLAQAAIESLVRDREAHRIQQSVGFYPRSVAYEGEGVLVYQSGWIEHTALTTIPVNPRTDMTLLLKGVGLTRRDDAALIVGPEFAASLDADYARMRAELSGKSLAIPDLPLGSKMDAILEVLCERLCVDPPVVVFSEAVDIRSEAPCLPLVVDPDVEAWLAQATGQHELTSEPIASIARSLADRVVASPGGWFPDEDLLALFAQKPSYAYLERLCGVLRKAVDEQTWTSAHRAARGYAGGTSYPRATTSVIADTFDAKPTHRIRDLTDSGHIGKMLRALVAIYDANEKAEIPHHEKVGNVMLAIEDLRRGVGQMLRQAQKSEAEEPSITIDLSGFTDADLISTRNRLRLQRAVAELLTAEV